jgi:hypothetical protein
LRFAIVDVWVAADGGTHQGSAIANQQESTIKDRSI